MTMNTAEATQLREILRKGREITTRAVTEKRELTAAEHADVMDALEAAAKADAAAKAAQAQAGVPTWEDLTTNFKAGPVADVDTGKPGHLSFNLSVKAARQAITTASGRVGLKALIAEGASIATVDYDTNVVAQGRPATSVLDLLPVLSVSEPQYAYLRQTTRTYNAAPVAPGELKPTSIYGLTRIDGRLKVIAHLSEPINKFDLGDIPSLDTFLRTELMAGLQAALVAQVFNGDGTGANFTGLANVSGILTQAFSGDTFTTLRKSLTALETAGYTPNGIVMHPSDWEAVELTREDGATGGFLLGNAPVDVARRKLWGLPVAATSTVPVGKAWVLSEGSAHIRMHAQDPGAFIEWGMVGDDFAKNLVRARAEFRADLSVEKPGGIVNVSLSA